MERLARKGMAALVGLALVSAAGLAQAETRFAVQDTAGVDKMVVTDQGFIGVGTNNPGTAFEIQGAPGNVNSRMLMRTFGATSAAGGGGVISLHNNAAGTNNSFPVAGDRLGFYLFGTKNGASNVTSAGIEALAAGNWNPATSVLPSYMRFVTGGGVRLTIDTNGNVGIGTGTPTQRLEVNGAIRLNTASQGTRPDCTSALRGVLYFNQAAAGAADSLAVCAKDGSEGYAWRPLF